MSLVGDSNCFPAAFAINLYPKLKIYYFYIINCYFKNIYFCIDNIQMNNMLSIDCISMYLVTILHNSLYIKWSKSACVLMNYHLALKFEYNICLMNVYVETE